MITLLGGRFGLEKKNIAPQKIPQFHLPGPSAPPPPGNPPPFLGFSIINQPPPAPGADSPFPLPEQKKIKNIRNVHQDLKPFLKNKMVWRNPRSSNGIQSTEYSEHADQPQACCKTQEKNSKILGRARGAKHTEKHNLARMARRNLRPSENCF